MRSFVKIFSFLTIFLSIHHLANAQQELAQQAFNIFEQYCLDCHGEFGSFTDSLIITHPELIKERAVISGNPDVSILYTRLLGDTDSGEQMPLGQEPLAAEEIAVIRRWIEVGAPDWEALPQPKRHFITTDAVLETIHSHVVSLDPFNRSYARYFTLTHLYNARTRDDNLRAYRNALSKLINSLSWGYRVVKPQPIDKEETIFYIDLRDYEWDRRNKPWSQIQRAYPYAIDFRASTYDAVCRETTCEVPFVRADWFIAAAALPPLYHEILGLPETDLELEAQLGVDVAENLQNAPGVRVWRAGFNESGVSRNNRIVERHQFRDGAYWKSYDFAANMGKQNIFEHPLDFQHDGGEIIFNLPNGLQAYYLSTASGERLDKAPVEIVSTSVGRDPVVYNGLSCMGCHTEGMKIFEDQVRLGILQIPNPPYDAAQALRLYVQKSEMDALIAEDIARYKRAIEAAGSVFGGSEPIQQLVKQFEDAIDAAHAAAEVGLEQDDFLQRIRENRALQSSSLQVLGSPKGNVKREAWTSQFGKVVTALNIGKYRKPPTQIEGEPSEKQIPPKIVSTPPRPKHVPIPLDTPFPDMVLIPAGEFQMGSSSGDFDEKPVHPVYLNAFYMDRYEVTNEQYRVFVDANPQWQKERISRRYHDGNYLRDWNGNNYPSEKANHPVVHVNWYGAMAYAAWVGKRLPTEAEWEKAARGGLVGNQYPSGSLIESSEANFNKNAGGTTPVGSYPPNDYGLYDMAGNAWEWCLDEYSTKFYANSPRTNPISGSGKNALVRSIINSFKNIKTPRVLRGGAWDKPAERVRPAYRYKHAPTDTTLATGFRCVRELTR